MSNSREIDEITRILAKQDPIGLVAAGAGVDEYSTEAEAISRSLHGARSAEDIQDICVRVFRRLMGGKLPRGAYSRFGRAAEEMGEQLVAQAE